MSHTSQNTLRELKLNKLPTLPTILIDILGACQDKTVTFEELAEIVSKDVAIAARAVSMANSTFFNRGVPIRSLDRALLVLGTDTIKTIVITATIHQFYSGIGNRNADFLRQFWRRSLSCALLAKSLAILTSYPKPDEAYLCGLLHNIGELVFASNHPNEYVTDGDTTESAKLSDEFKQFGIDHAELGALLLEQWSLSTYAIDAVRYHHSPLEKILGAHHLVKIMFMASELSASDVQQVDTHAGETLFELNPSLVFEIQQKIRTEVEDVASSMGIRLNQTAEQDRIEHKKLGQALRDCNLLSTAEQHLENSQSKEEFCRHIRHTFSLLFGLRDVAVFWAYDDKLKLVDESRDAIPLEFSISEDTSVVAKSALSGEITGITKTAIDCKVADLQIMRMLRLEEITCLPLSTGKRTHAVIVTDINTNQDAIHPKFLSLFLKQLADQCPKIESESESRNSDYELELLNAKIKEIAHEANNPLSIIGNYLASLSLKLDDKQEVKDELAVLKEELERASHIIMRLRDVQQIELETEKQADINNEIQNLLTLYKNSLFLAKQIDCTFTPEKGLQPTDISGGVLRQILTNLIKNAVEALPQGGKIEIATKGSVNVNGRPFTEIKIKDNGPGIPKLVLENLFQPVPTTKGEGHSGLGLSITKNLVTDARGTITCRTDNTGTQFQILFPAN